MAIASTWKNQTECDECHGAVEIIRDEEREVELRCTDPECGHITVLGVSPLAEISEAE